MSRVVKGYWARFGYCPTCERTAGAPCRDLRYGRGESFSTDRAHRGRPKKDAS